MIFQQCCGQSFTKYKLGPKTPEFEPVFKMLEVQIDASEATQGAFAVGHAETRKQELVATCLARSQRA